MRQTPWSWARVIKACTELTWPQKAIWLEVADLDQGPEGAFITIESLALRLGRGAKNIEDDGKLLRSFGLIVSKPRKALLPECCQPKMTHPSDTEIKRLADLLDGHIRTRRRPSKSDTLSTSSDAASASAAAEHISQSNSQSQIGRVNKLSQSKEITEIGINKNQDWRKVLEQYLGPRPSSNNSTAA